MSINSREPYEIQNRTLLKKAWHKQLLKISGSALTLYRFISTISHTFLKKEVQE